MEIKILDPVVSFNPLKQEVNKPKTEAATSSFYQAFLKALEKVNTSQLKAEKLIRDFVINPNSVSIHTVTTALAQAEMNIVLAKSVIDRIIAAYRELTTLR